MPDSRTVRRVWKVVGLALLALGVSLAIAFLGLRAWRERPPPASAAERAAAAALRTRLSATGERVGLDEARRRAAREEEAGRAALALDLFVGAAASGDPEAELALAIQALRVPTPDRLSHEEARALVAVVTEESPKARLLHAARGWALLAADKPVEALDALARDPGTLEGRLARVRALVMLGQDATAEAEEVLKLKPAHAEACEILGRAALAKGDLAAARARLRACVEDGADNPTLYRLLGDAADAAGRFAEARDAYARGGALLHAAAITLQEGLPDPEGIVEAALADPAPPAALFAAWAGLLRGDLALAQASAKRLEQSGMPGPEAALARAAVALAAGSAASARSLLAQLSSPEAKVLYARAAALSRDPEGAARAFAEAAEAAPWNLALHRERLAWAAAERPEELLAAARALAGVDPVTLGLARLSRRRDAPWQAVAPSPWPELAPGPAATLVTAALAPDRLLVPGASPDGLEVGDRALVDAHRAWALAARGELARAREAAASAAGGHPDDPGIRALAADLALEAGDRAGASTWLQVAQASDPAPGVAALAWVRARAALASGDASGARATLLEAARADQDLAGLWSSLLALDEGGVIPAPGPDRLTAGLGSTR